MSQTHVPSKAILKGFPQSGAADARLDDLFVDSFIGRAFGSGAFLCFGSGEPSGEKMQMRRGATYKVPTHGESESPGLHVEIYGGSVETIW